MGFGEDVYQVAMVGSKKKKDLLANLDPLPGHRSKLEDLFQKIETVSVSFILTSLVVPSSFCEENTRKCFK